MRIESMWEEWMHAMMSLQRKQNINVRPVQRVKHDYYVITLNRSKTISAVYRFIEIKTAGYIMNCKFVKCMKRLNIICNKKPVSRNICDNYNVLFGTLYTQKIKLTEITS